MQNEELKRAHLDLEAARDRYSDLYDFAPIGYTTFGSSGLILEANLAAASLLGTERSRLLRRPFSSFIVPEDEDVFYLFRRRLNASPDRQSLELRLRKPDGSTIPARLDAVSMTGPDSQTQVRMVIVDLTERKKAESLLKSALDEKEALLREVHHRVKNNLQAIVSLAQMKASQTANPEAVRLLLELLGQARAMAMVYERLFLSRNMAHIEMSAYLKQLSEFVLEAFGSGRTVGLDFDLEEMTLDIEQALPAGMLVNELETNALKYAFPPGFKGNPVIRVGLRAKDGMVRLTVADNGVGLPPGLKIGTTDSLGLRLAHLWATQQLGGTWEISGPPGLAFHVAFPI
ncbi:MAG: histidine kinase dimerization/phosphoacceptor domain -containing protein [Candidatus Aminicenantales bacterium]